MVHDLLCYFLTMAVIALLCVHMELCYFRLFGYLYLPLCTIQALLFSLLKIASSPRVSLLQWVLEICIIFICSVCRETFRSGYGFSIFVWLSRSLCLGFVALSIFGSSMPCVMRSSNDLMIFYHYADL